ncbi:MAG TPA: hypothetical protein VIY48_15250 [Candidatus Paceibacterota bacterium]
MAKDTLKNWQDSMHRHSTQGQLTEARRVLDEVERITWMECGAKDAIIRIRKLIDAGRQRFDPGRPVPRHGSGP